MKNLTPKQRYDQQRYQRIKEERQSRRAADPIDMIPETAVAYIAGIIDGEGCITISRTKNRLIPTLSIIMTSRPLLDWLAETLAVECRPLKRKDVKPHHKPQFKVVLTGKRSARLLKRCIPMMIVKQPQAELVMSFVETYIQQRGPGGWIPPEVMNQREKIKEEISRLNDHRRNTII